MNGKLLFLSTVIMCRALIASANTSTSGYQPELKTAVAPQWRNLKGIDIIPCPKKITVYDKYIPINENLAILIGKSASERTKAAAEDLQQIIRGKTSVTVPVIDNGADTGGKNLIIMGTPDELPRIRQSCKSARISWKGVEKQGYAIFPEEQNLVLVGKDRQGVYWAAMTLACLIKDKKIRVAGIIDWPDFKNRICETLMGPMRLLFDAKTEKQKAAAWEKVKAGVREAAGLKFNYVKCWASLWACPPPKTDFPVGKRAQLLKKIGEYANKRGIKLYLQFCTVVAAQGDEKKFPQLKDCVKFLHLYATWSDDELINHACKKITQMAKIIGPQFYFFHSPDIPDMGWPRRSEKDRKRWGNDRVAAEIYLVTKMYNALKKGCPGAIFNYVTNPYAIGYANDSPQNIKQLKIVKRLNSKLPGDIVFIWREGSLESAKDFRKLTKNRPQRYHIEDSSFHKGRLLGGIARTAKTFYFKNEDDDYFFDNCNTSPPWDFLIPQNYILAEYSWNTQAPGAVFIQQNDDKKSTSHRGRCR